MARASGVDDIGLDGEKGKRKLTDMRNGRWSCDLREMVESPEKVEMFLNEIEGICRKYNMSISHEDCQGAFRIAAYDDYLIDWLRSANLEKGFPITHAALPEFDNGDVG